MGLFKFFGITEIILLTYPIQIEWLRMSYAEIAPKISTILQMVENILRYAMPNCFYRSIFNTELLIKVQVNVIWRRRTHKNRVCN